MAKRRPRVAIRKTSAAKPQVKEKPVGVLDNPAPEDLVRIRTCVNCGQSVHTIKVTVPAGGEAKDARMECPVCKHEWGMDEERAPHRLGFSRTRK